MGDEEAITKLVKLDDAGKLNQYDLQFFVSQEYGKYNRDLQRNAMLKSLELFPVEVYTQNRSMFGAVTDRPTITDKGYAHLEIFPTLSMMYYKDEKFDKAYLFAKLLTLNGDTSADLQLIKHRLKKGTTASLMKPSVTVYQPTGHQNKLRD